MKKLVPVVAYSRSAPELSAFGSRLLSSALLIPALVVLLLSTITSFAQDQPTIQKDSVQVTAFTLSSYKKDFKVFSWVPRLRLRVNGPIASGSQIYAEFTAPGGVAWKFDCKTEETGTGHWWQPDE